MDYKSAGVDIDLGNEVSKVLYEAAKITWENRKGTLGEVVELFPDFSGLRAVHVGGLPHDAYMNMGFDGVGTKIELAERRERHDTVANDLFAMVCDDAIIRGAEPVIFGSLLDVRSLGNKDESYIDFVKQLAIGYINAAKEANVAVVNGEVAELGARVSGYGPFNYNWNGGVTWFARKSKMLSGNGIKSGDYLVGLKEEGLRSNGFSLIRKIMQSTYGNRWHDVISNGERLGNLALHPSRIYTNAVIDMTGGFYDEPKAEVHGIAHITGGGIPEKLGRTLKPTDLGADIYNPFEPPEIMQLCQSIGNVTDREAYRTWNMGQGMVILTPNPDSIIAVAAKHGIESGIIGEVIKRPGIMIKSKGLDREELLF